MGLALADCDDIIKIRSKVMSKYTQAELKASLIREKVNETTLYYSLVKKQGKTISFLTNDRLLIYDNNRRIIYYNNDFKNAPFGNFVPQPKNDTFTPLQGTVFKNPSNSNNIEVRHTGKNAKGELETIEWNFTCETVQLAREWMQLIEEEKNLLMGSMLGQKGAGFIHDTLINAISKQDGPSKETILKPEEQVIKPNPQPDDNIQNSRLSTIKKGELQLSHALDPSLKGENSQLRASKLQNDSRISINNSNRIQEVKPNESLHFNSREPSQINEKKSIKQAKEDWNFRFLKGFNEATLAQFERAALMAFKSIWQRDSAVLKDLRRVYDSSGFRISVSNMFSQEARLLKRQFRNYHFILESCKNNLIIGVPLTCLIEWQGVVALVKAPLPYQCAEMRLSSVLGDIRELQRYTRVSNAVLDRCTIYDATEVYGGNGDKRLLYVDNLIEYLPINVNEDVKKSSLRPQYLLDTVSQIIPGGEVKPINRAQWKVLSSVCAGIDNCIKDLTQHLNNQQTLWADALQLKEIFHSYGVNMKYLAKVYSQVSNKQVKKYVQTVMAAKVAKELINQAIIQSRLEDVSTNSEELVEEFIRNFIEGSNSLGSQFWKQLSIKFKKQFGLPLNNAEILGGFFLNSLLKLMNVSCDMSKLNKTKKIFKDEAIILQRFVVAAQPKSKIYHRFTSEFIDKVKYACKYEKKDEEIYQEIVHSLQLQQRSIPIEYSRGSKEECILEYLSYYTPPKNIDPSALLKNIPIYKDVFKEPPNSFVLRLSKNYLFWCIKKDKGEEFKKGSEEVLKIADYWFDERHIFHCSLYQLFSDYYAATGNGEDSIKFMKESLNNCIKICGAQSRQAGTKYYELGERQLKVGHKKEALDNFIKAKVNMESNQNQSLKYPQLLMRLAALHLNNGNIDNSIEGALQAIRQFEQYDKRSGSSGLQTEGYKIKTYEVLSRAYEINNKKEQIKEMANQCARKFNKSKAEQNFEQMVRICLAAVIFRQPLERCQRYLQFITQISRKEHAGQQNSLKQLMNLADSMIVMEKFMGKFESLEKVIAEGTSTRGYSHQSKEFISIGQLTTGVVGQDYIEGLVNQKLYE